MEKDIVLKANEINIRVSYCLELLGVIYKLTDFKMNKERNNKKYRGDIDSYFKSYKNHIVVDKFNKLLKNMYFNYDAPVHFMLTLFNNQKVEGELLSRCAMNQKEIMTFKQELDNFIEVSNFDKFFNDHKEEYKINIERFINDLDTYLPQIYLFDFLKLKSDNLNVILMKNITDSNYGVMVNEQLYCCIRPYKYSKYDQEDYCNHLGDLTTLILHEFAHSFINPLTDKYKERIAKIDKRKFREIFDKNSYGEHKETAINETIIRTIECLYLKDNDNLKEYYNEIKEDYYQSGFIMIGELEKLFKDKYLSNRDKYPSIKDFYEEIITFFEKERVR